MNKIKIPWWNPQIGDEEHILIKKVLDNNFPNEGEFTTQFEKKIGDLVKCKYVIATTSCTAAMFLSLKALGIGYGDEVIVPDMTFISTANSINLSGAKPVLVDVDPKTLNIDPNSISSAITKKTKAVMPVHVTGRAADMDLITEIADKNNIFVVEDAAEGFMSKNKGKYLGTIGKLGCLSFSPAKTITTGQGGAILINDEETYIRLKELKDQGRPKRGTGGDDIHDSIGYNFKFTDLQAAVGLGQLTYLKTRIERLKRNYNLYAENLKDVKGISVFDFDIANDEIPQWTDALVENRKGMDDYLTERHIDCRRFWFPLHTQTPYKLPDANFPNSTKLSPKAIWLPSAFTLCDDDVMKVCTSIKEFMKL